MATTISGAGPHLSARVAMDATPGNVERVTLPPWVRVLTVTFLQSDGSADTGKIAWSGTDGAAIGNEHFPIASGAAYSYAVRSSRTKRPVHVVYIAGGTASGFAHVHCEA